MARTFTVGQRTAIGSGHYNAYAKVELMDSEGNWRDVSSYFDADHFNRAVLRRSVDDNCWRLTLELTREALGTSLSPLMESSEANRDSMDDYAPFLDPSRQWRAYCAILAHGATLVGGDWELLCQGTYGKINIQSPSPIIRLTGRDLGASLLDCYIDEERWYGDNDNPIAMEDVIQQLLDDNLGVGAITLDTPVSPSFVMNRFNIKDMNLMAAVNLVAAKAGFVVGYRFDASDNFKLTLYEPNREAVADDGEEDWELGPDEYLAVPDAEIDDSGVRNYIIVHYWDESANKVLPIIAQDADSIARFGGPHGLPRRMAIDLSEDTNVTTAARATAFAEAVLADLKTPPFTHQVVATGFWIAELGDWGKFLANDIHYDVDQFAAVTAIEHVIENGNLKTTLNVGGQPRGRYRTWVANKNLIRGVPEVRIKNHREISRTDTTVTYGFEVDGVCDQLWLWTSTPTQPVGSDPWPPKTSRPTARYDSDQASVTIDIPTAGAVTYAALAAIDANGVISKRWEWTVQGELTKLVQRVTQMSKTATAVVMRVEVANPVAAGNVTIGYESDGVTSVSPATGQTLVAASVPSALAATAAAATAGSYVDFTITRAVTNGYVVFTASATDRQPDTDPVVVPALDGIGQAAIALDISGNGTLTADGPLWAASLRYATSSSDFPSDATVVASGTTVNARQIAAAIASATAIGASLYATIIAFSGSGATGIQGTSFRVKATRHDFTATKTVYQSFATIIAPVSSLTGDNYIEYYASGGYLRNYNWPGTYPGGVWGGYGYLDFIIPDGVTAQEFGFDLYAAASISGGVTCYIDRMAGDGTATNVGNVAANTSGWQTRGFSCSESTTGRRYRLRIEMVGYDPMVGQHRPTDGEIRASVWYYVQSMPSSLNTI